MRTSPSTPTDPAPALPRFRRPVAAIATTVGDPPPQTTVSRWEGERDASAADGAAPSERVLLPAGLVVDDAEGASPTPPPYMSSEASAPSSSPHAARLRARCRLRRWRRASCRGVGVEAAASGTGSVLAAGAAALPPLPVSSRSCASSAALSLRSSHAGSMSTDVKPVPMRVRTAPPPFRQAAVSSHARAGTACSSAEPGRAAPK